MPVYPNDTIFKLVCQTLKHIKETQSLHLCQGFSVIKTLLTHCKMRQQLHCSWPLPDNKHSADQRKKRLHAEPLTRCWVRASYDRTSDVTAPSHWNNESSKLSDQPSKLSSFSTKKVVWAAPYNVELLHAAPRETNIIKQAHVCSLAYFWSKPRRKRTCMSIWIHIRKNLIALNKNILKKTEIILVIAYT